jgi:hypothetical protein
MTWETIESAPEDGTDVLVTGTYDVDGMGPGGTGVAGERMYAIAQWNIYWGQTPAWAYSRDGGRVTGVTLTHWAALTAPGA